MRLAFSRLRLPVVVALLTTAFVLISTQTIAVAENAPYSVKPGDTLLSIAIDLGVPDGRLSGWMDDVVKLNSLSSPDALSVGQKLTLPAGSGSSGSSASVTSTAGGASYTVQSGDTLYDIAAKNRVPDVALSAWLDSVLQLNSLASADLLKEGDVLRLPNVSGAAKPSLTQVSGGTINTSATTNYTVLSGDTLHDIANKSGVSDASFSAWVDAVLKLNNLSSPDLLQEGGVLKIPGKASGSSSSSSASARSITSTVSYTVKPGDTLYDIAAKNGVTDSISDWVDAVLSLNNLASADMVQEGSVLKVPGKASSPASSGSSGASSAAAANATSTISYTVRPGDTLYDIAAKNGVTDGLGAWIDTVLALNNIESADMLRQGAVIKVPSIPGRSTTSDSSNAPAPAAASTPPISNTYSVRAGETFQGIARKLGVQEDVMSTWIDQVVMLSRINKNDPLVDGEVLLVPSPPTPQAQASTLPSQTQSSDIKTPASASNKPTTSYAVQPGDTLSDIAAKFKVASGLFSGWIKDVINLNSLSSADFLAAGQKILVPGEEPAPPKPAAVAAPAVTPPPFPSIASAPQVTRAATTPGVTKANSLTCFYTVAQGDTWLTIAQKLGVNDASRASWIDGISALNGIAAGAAPPVGDALRMLC